MVQSEKLPSQSTETNNFSQVLLETIPLGIDIVDGDGRILFLNKKWEETFGKEVVGKKCWDVYKDNKKQCDHCPLKNGGFLQEVKDFETVGVNGGKTYQIIHSGIRYKGENAVLKIYYDITDRKRAEEEMMRLGRELERSNKELEQFACVCSHELQEPLRMVASYTNLLARRYQGKLDDDADDFIKFAVDGASRMQWLLRDLLTYSRIGQDQKEFVPVDCNGVLKRVLATMGMMIKERGAAITYQSLPVVLGNEIELEQVFENLLTNALKFCNDTPRIHIQAKRQPHTLLKCGVNSPSEGIPLGDVPRPKGVPIDIGNLIGTERQSRLRGYNSCAGTQPRGEEFVASDANSSRTITGREGGAERLHNEWLFSVKDNGIGIAPEHTGRLFIIFQQIYDKHKYPGTGVGLAICKKVIERHGGRIWVESEPKGTAISEPDKGATFYFTVPDRVGDNERLERL